MKCGRIARMYLLRIILTKIYNPLSYWRMQNKLHITKWCERDVVIYIFQTLFIHWWNRTNKLEIWLLPLHAILQANSFCWLLINSHLKYYMMKCNFNGPRHISRWLQVAPDYLWFHMDMYRHGDVLIVTVVSVKECHTFCMWSNQRGDQQENVCQAWS